MIFDYIFGGEGCSLKSGIYKIHNTSSNKFYIGQSKEFKSRWNGHKKALLGNSRKCNKYLKNSFKYYYKKLGHTDFLIFSIIELIPNSTQEERETREEEIRLEYVQKYGENRVYSDKVIKQGEKTVWSYTPEETKEKLSQSIKQLWKENKYQSRKNKKLEEIYGKEKAKEVKEKMSKSHIGIQLGEKHPLFGLTHKELYGKDRG